MISPATGHDDGLEAIGYVLLGAEEPIVVCAVDWAGLLNDAHRAWCETLARAAGTSPERVAVQCVHQHAAPFVSPDAEATVSRHADLPSTFDPQFFEACLRRADEAVRAALQNPQRITRIAHGSAPVRQVASNRRVQRDASGRVSEMRFSACQDPVLIAAPEGTIDPDLQTVAFYGEDGGPIVACHYYATHPMSYYRDGRVSSDFCGLARKRRQAETPGCTQIYFTGCSGNVAAGKYNDGTPAARIALSERIHAALVASEKTLAPAPIESVEWRTEAVLPPPRDRPTASELEVAIADRSRNFVDRLLTVFQLAWRQRYARGRPLILSALCVNDIAMLHLPGEMFVEHQLAARAQRPHRPVAVAAYGDGGPWYIPTRAEYPNGGYEVGVAFCREDVEGMISEAVRKLLA